MFSVYDFCIVACISLVISNGTAIKDAFEKKKHLIRPVVTGGFDYVKFKIRRKVIDYLDLNPVVTDHGIVVPYMVGPHRYNAFIRKHRESMTTILDIKDEEGKSQRDYVFSLFGYYNNITPYHLTPRDLGFKTLTIKTLMNDIVFEEDAPIEL